VQCNGLCVVRSSCESCTWPNSTSREPVDEVGVFTSSLCTNYTNVTQAAIDGVSEQLTCGWASAWHFYWFSLFYGLCFVSVFALLLRWANLDAMYDCPCYGAEIRQTWANRMAIYSMIMGYYAFFNVSLNINNMPPTRPWPYKEQMSTLFPRWAAFASTACYWCWYWFRCRCWCLCWSCCRLSGLVEHILFGIVLTYCAV
jgi:hypothetical protein